MRVSVPNVEVRKLYDSDIWPVGVVVSPWRFKSQSQLETDRISFSFSFSAPKKTIFLFFGVLFFGRKRILHFRYFLFFGQENLIFGRKKRRRKWSTPTTGDLRGTKGKYETSQICRTVNAAHTVDMHQINEITSRFTIIIDCSLMRSCFAGCTARQY